MRYFFLVWTGLWRRRTRTILTLLSAIVAFFLFGTLQGVDSAINQLLNGLHLDRLTTSGNNGQLPLPLAYRAQIAAVPGVSNIVAVNAAVGYYQAPANLVAIYATDPKAYFRLYPENVTTPADIAAIANTRDGAIISQALANQFHLKRGDRISLHIAAMPRTDHTLDWSVEVAGIGTLTTNLTAPFVIINYDYFDAARLSNKGTVQLYMMHIADPARAGEISAAIDALFANSPAVTRTQTERDFAQGALAQLGDIDFFIDMIIGAAFFTLLLLVGNALMQSFRERRKEFAVLKAIGFSDALVAALLIEEAMVFCVAAALFGLLLSRGFLPLLGRATGGGFTPHMSLGVLTAGLALGALVGLVSGAIPAWRAGRLVIADALAR
jgi:putative ABC transport system permease protein